MSPSTRNTFCCELCRRRKGQYPTIFPKQGTHYPAARCDGKGPNTGHCSRCQELNLECTYPTIVNKRGPKSKLVEELRKQIEVLEARLRSRVCAHCSRPTLKESPPELSSELTSLFRRSPENEEEPEQDATDGLADSFRRIAIVGTRENQFYSLGSSLGLLSTAFDEKDMYLGQAEKRPPNYRILQPRRRVYWDPPPWEKRLRPESPAYVYPPDDLIDSLLELYFTNVHPIFPVLHRNSFQESVAEKQHLIDPKFGATLLAVLAVASRYSHDTRVLIRGETSFLCSGWKFVAQVQISPIFFGSSIHDMQFYCLMTLFTMATSAQHNSRAYIGFVLCCIEQRHWYPKDGSTQRTFEEQLWSRAFWSVVALDRMGCACLGSPSAVQTDNYNFETPLDVDDDYWGRGLAQPFGHPSLLSYFRHSMRLSEIYGDALSRLYASKKKKLKMGWVGARWEADTVAQLDSAMNAFLDSIPPHLRWDPDKTWNNDRERAFFDQSAVLYATYYYTQITIHRPFIRKENPLTKTSLSICTTAARSALHIALVWVERFHCVASPFLQHSSFVSAIIIYLNLFASKRAGRTAENSKDHIYVAAAVDVMRLSETRYHQAGRMLELIQQLMYKDNQADKSTVPPHILTSAGNLKPSGKEVFPPGTSIEQLLAETADTSVDFPPLVNGDKSLEGGAAPTDLMNLSDWELYMETVGNTGVFWAGV